MSLEPKPKESKSTSNLIGLAQHIEKAGLEALLNYIENTKQFYASQSLSLDNFFYDPENKQAHIEIVTSEIHRGTGKFVHGGFLSSLIDSCSGTLGMILAGGTNVVMTRDHAHIKFKIPVTLGKKISIVSSLDGVIVREKYLKIKTEIFLDGRCMVSSVSNLVIVSKETLERLQRNAK